MPQQNTRQPLYIAMTLAVGAIAYFINGLTQAMTKIPIVLGVGDYLEGEVGRLAPTQAVYYSETLVGIERIANDHTTSALAVLLIAAAIACAPQIRRAINLEVPRSRGQMTAMFLILAAIVPSSVAHSLNTWILERQGVELGERYVRPSDFLELVGLLLFVGIALLIYVSRRVKAAQYAAYMQQNHSAPPV